MPSSCAVLGCSKGGSFRFPSNESMCLKWRIALKRKDANGFLWSPSPYSVLCGEHFKPEDFREVLQSLAAVGGKAYRHLKKDAVPSVFPWSQEGSKNQPEKKHCLIKNKNVNENKISNDDSIIADPAQYGNVVLVEEGVLNPTQDVDYQTDPLIIKDEYVQYTSTNENIIRPLFSIGNFVNDPSAIVYYTGLSDYNHFKDLFFCLGPAVNHLCYKIESLTRQDELFLTLMKLRQNKDDIELGIIFHIHRTSVKKVFITWVNFMFDQFKEIDRFLSNDTIDNHLPVDFQTKFPNTIMILDSTKVKTNKTSNVTDQTSKWSSYKSNDTITGNDLLTKHEVKVNTPSPMRGVNQPPEARVINEIKAASKKIHVEKTIRLDKTYKILQEELNRHKTPLSGRIIYVCFVCCNFRKSTVARSA
ncbi:uncharacterized protein [Lepeophtheirus salmonis]|uniref:uncharacterized protein isoform X2 n=1 Tax=Lepeophtheirus salmonis TaxID=72036 RepID=UPI001AE9E984|nr:uncharacterized protein LOC121122778 [Lepeophtheirus salmonis]XP_040573754.1 uncharacterized protein LOC121122778 [Lepeophtheirus salmonis]XP_040573755.1 uncharacterized protein LOC121122778 [Lepeophtheirus salmonis]XP_040573757.1 uncharacterized protein LOC121122778 [Lepeophtheirus salmonis]XP_040573758.1 uncharacterized protein LOC121122778 [Lepeophtheirus salmonis]XP_040573759.1 uncharacterized protein LOC121122778 [Lepeophtheirus salmonis]XP_040573760.1 uncharacterized protein LOC12112